MMYSNTHGKECFCFRQLAISESIQKKKAHTLTIDMPSAASGTGYLEARRGYSKLLKSFIPAGTDFTVPPTPANTPQNSTQLPNVHRGLAELGGGSILPSHLSNRIEKAGSVPPTPHNTPQRSTDLPAAVRERLLSSPKRSTGDLSSEKGASEQ